VQLALRGLEAIAVKSNAAAEAVYTVGRQEMLMLRWHCRELSRLSIHQSVT